MEPESVILAGVYPLTRTDMLEDRRKPGLGLRFR